MAKYLGKDGIIKTAAAEGTPAELAQVTGFTLETSAELVDQTALGDSYRRRAAGVKDFSLSVTLFYDSTGSVGQDIFIEGAEFDFELLPEAGETATNMLMSGTAIIGSMSMPVEVDGTVTLEISAEGNSALTRAAYSAS